jgi:hypothetical protein
MTFLSQTIRNVTTRSRQNNEWGKVRAKLSSSSKSQDSEQKERYWQETIDLSDTAQVNCRSEKWRAIKRGHQTRHPKEEKFKEERKKSKNQNKMNDIFHFHR